MHKGAPESDGWIELPGLFDSAEISGITELQIRARPLVIVGSRTLYGVYVRECANDGSERETSGVRSIDMDAVVQHHLRRQART